MSQEKILKFLKANPNLWVNQQILKVHFFLTEKRDPSEWKTLEVEINRAIVRLNFSEQITRKPFGVVMFYKYKEI